MGDGLGIALENATVSHQDSRGTGKALALWFQDMAEARLILPIQKAHFRHYAISMMSNQSAKSAMDEIRIKSALT